MDVIFLSCKGTNTFQATSFHCKGKLDLPLAQAQAQVHLEQHHSTMGEI
jgi:hypothetical protein